MKKKVKLFLLVAAGLAVLAIAAYTYMAPTPVPLTVVSATTAELRFTEQGLFTANTVIQIYPMVQGRLIELNVQEGQSVREGDVLCTVDAEPLLQRIDQIRGSIRGYEAQIRSLSAQEQSSNATLAERMRLQNTLIEQNEKNLDSAKEDLARAEALYEAGALAKTDVDAARSAADQLETSLAAAQAELAVIAAGAGSVSLADYYRALISVEQINIAQLEKDIENCRVSATASGVVTRLNAKNTNLITTAAPVAEITVSDGGAIEVFISTSDVDSVHAGDIVELILKRREGDISLAGRVDQVETNAEVKLSALGLEERKVKVRITPERAGTEGITLGAGYDVDVRFTLYREENKLTVPKTALYKDEGRDMVWALRNGSIQATEVVTGMELRTEFVVESGLTEGDAVVTDANNDALREGLKVVDAG